MRESPEKYLWENVVESAKAKNLDSRSTKAILYADQRLRELEEQTRQRVTAEEPPSGRGNVLAINTDNGGWQIRGVDTVLARPDRHPIWLPLPPTQEVGG